MDRLWPALVILAAFGLVVVFLAWLRARSRRSGVSTGVLGVYDEIYRPTAHEALIVIQVQDERRTPTPSPGGHKGSRSAR